MQYDEKQKHVGVGLYINKNTVVWQSRVGYFRSRVKEPFSITYCHSTAHVENHYIPSQKYYSHSNVGLHACICCHTSLYHIECTAMVKHVRSKMSILVR